MSKTKRRRRRRRRKRKRKKDAVAASSKDTIKIYDNSDVDVPWSNLNHDVLSLVMMRLGIVELFAFSGVCKLWRSLAISNKNKFIVSRPPMSVHVSGDANKEECHFEDFEGNKFKPIIPHYAGRRCIGVTSGYLVLWGEKKNDLWLVNLMTRHELNFPEVPNELLVCCSGDVRTIFVFSPSIFGWVLVVLNFWISKIWFSVAGKREWIRVSNTSFALYDLYAFKENIYTIHSEYKSDQWRLCELRFYPEPKLVLLETESIPISHFRIPEFVSCGENLYVIDRHSTRPYKNIHKLVFDLIKLVPDEKKGKEYAFFFQDGENHSAGMIIDLRSQYGRYAVTDKNENENFFFAEMWYFFHDCLDANSIHE